MVFIIANDRPCDLIAEDDAEQPILVILDKTPFYGEMGGQVGDTGELVGEGFRFEVVDTQVNGALILHRGHLREGRLELGAAVSARVNPQRRAAIRRAHSATHLLHYALRKHLGEHALQQGSKVDDDLLRFDFANPSAVGAEALARIESEVNDKILEGEPVRSTVMPLAEARKSGAMMLFGEKYPDMVRMVSIGSFSKELCGGTHLDNAAKIGLLKIVGEESVAAGTRRITALTGRSAAGLSPPHARRAGRTAAALHVPPEEVPERVELMAKELKQAKKLSAAGAKKAEGAGVEGLLAAATKVAGTTVVIAETTGGPQVLRQLIDQLRRKSAPIAVMLGARQDEGKVMLVAGFSRDLVDRGLDAVAWVRTAAALVGGSGGGRADMAQAGGKNPEKMAEALAAAQADIEKLLRGA